MLKMKALLVLAPRAHRRSTMGSDPENQSRLLHLAGRANRPEMRRCANLGASAQPAVTIGGVSAHRVPTGIPSGEAAVIATIGGMDTRPVKISIATL